jgi:hypothetical protein
MFAGHAARSVGYPESIGPNRLVVEFEGTYLLLHWLDEHRFDSVQARDRITIP